jgi:NitT/TauT family transport system substrate-binding protein
VRRALLLLTLVLVAASFGRPLAAQTPVTLRVGMTLSDCCAEAYYAQELGLFQKHGVNVDLGTFASGSALAEAVAGNAVDIGIATPLAVIEGISRNVPLTIIAGGGMNTVKAPTTTLMVAGASTIRSAADLNGKTIAVIALKTTSEFGVRIWMQQNGADPSTVRFIELPFPAMGAALQRGTVAAAVMSDPAMSIAKEKTDARPLANPSNSIAKEYMLSAWFAGKDAVEKNRDAMRRFNAAIYEAARWANTHHDQSAVMLAKVSNVDLSLIQRSTRVVYAESLRAQDLAPQLDVAYRFTNVGRKLTVDDLMEKL